jgi:hypothetical protein
MSATHTHGLSTRRSALGFSAAAIVAGLTTPVLAKGVKKPDSRTGPDAELIAACEEAIRQDGIKDAINRGEFGGDDDAVNAASDDWWEAFERVAEIPATAMEGVRAKARVLRLAVQDGVCAGIDWTVADHGDIHDRMADALCNEILALGDVA